MKIIYIVLLFAFVQQNDASKKNNKGNRTLGVLKKGALSLALLYGANPQTNDGHFFWEPIENDYSKLMDLDRTAPQLPDSNPKHFSLEKIRVFPSVSAETQTIVCPKVPQRNAVELMNYVICYQHQEPEFEKYLMNIDKCENVKSLFEKALELGECVLNAPKVIIQGVKSRLFGTEPESNLEMLEAHLKTLNVNTAHAASSWEAKFKMLEARVEKYGRMLLVGLENGKLEISDSGLAEIEKIDNFNFFNVKQAAEFFQKYKNLTTEDAFEEALRSQRQHLNFDEVESTMKCAKKMWPKSDSKAAEEALYRKQLSLQFHLAMRHVDSLQKFKQLRKELTPEKAMEQTVVLPITPETADEPLKSNYQYLNFDKIDSKMKCGEQMWQESDTVAAKEALEFAHSVYGGLHLGPYIEELNLFGGWDQKIFETASKTALQKRFEHFDVEEFLKIVKKDRGEYMTWYDRNIEVYEEALKHSHKLNLISLEDISRAVETSLSSRTPKTTFREKIKVLYYKEAKKQGIDTYDL